jgi:hypothetical protein
MSKPEYNAATTGRLKRKLQTFLAQGAAEFADSINATKCKLQKLTADVNTDFAQHVPDVESDLLEMQQLLQQQQSKVQDLLAFQQQLNKNESDCELWKACETWVPAAMCPCPSIPAKFWDDALPFFDVTRVEGKHQVFKSLQILREEGAKEEPQIMQRGLQRLMQQIEIAKEKKKGLADHVRAADENMNAIQSWIDQPLEAQAFQVVREKEALGEMLVAWVPVRIRFSRFSSFTGGSSCEFYFDNDDTDDDGDDDEDDDPCLDLWMHRTFELQNDDDYGEWSCLKKMLDASINLDSFPKALWVQEKEYNSFHSLKLIEYGPDDAKEGGYGHLICIGWMALLKFIPT